ncbi:MAG TPA: DUF4189 domain-containing protein [Burkholderiales bacterium]|nr:DUF4189 domain-containing protein [Burkholderiales bacterium]
MAALLALGLAGSALAAERAPTRNQYYAAIAYHAETNSVGWSTDRRSAREAKVEALKQCGHERCEVVASITRGCGALARVEGGKFAVQKGATRAEAETKALKRCGPKCQVLAWTCTR